jgi:hypothetical protein
MDNLRGDQMFFCEKIAQMIPKNIPKMSSNPSFENSSPLAANSPVFI